MTHKVQFFVGLPETSKAWCLDRAFISVNRVRRSQGFLANEWVMDSGAFTEITTHRAYRSPVAEYARTIRDYAGLGQLRAAVAQDFMCEPFVLKLTGATVAQHQAWTIERYDDLTACDTGGVYIMPVLQGFAPWDYQRHVEAYGDRLNPGAWVGVGSVCKRNGSPSEIARVLNAIHEVRPDLRLHGFGVKLASLKSERVVRRLATADSMAWAYNARKNDRDQNDLAQGRYYELMVLKALSEFDADDRGVWADAFARQLIRHRFTRIQADAAQALGRPDLAA